MATRHLGARLVKPIYQSNDQARNVRVFERIGDGSRLYYDDTVLYTHVDRHGENRLAYVAAMARVLSEHHAVLMLGTAGGALATQISRRGGQVTAVDDWDGAFAIARQWFGLPAEVECVHADAIAFLKSTSRQWDAVAIDVFQGTEIPAALLNEGIVALLTSVLTPGGMIVWNVADEPLAWTTQRIAKLLRKGGVDPRMVAVLDGDVGNTLVVCDGVGATRA
jgi:spermidine synthase